MVYLAVALKGAGRQRRSLKESLVWDALILLLVVGVVVVSAAVDGAVVAQSAHSEGGMRIRLHLPAIMPSLRCEMTDIRSVSSVIS